MYGDQCGNVTVGAQCCTWPPDYCQPWDPSNYPCRHLKDPKCDRQQVEVNFYGDDIAKVFDLLLESCCDACHALAEGKAYTFVNFNPAGKFLKKGTGVRERSWKRKSLR